MRKLNACKVSSAIEARAMGDLASCNISGASVAVLQGDEIIYKNHFGNGVTDGTLFRIASMTKPITAVAAMILADRGLLSLEDTVDSFYPAFSSVCVKGDDGSLSPLLKKITVRNLLTHSSGIGSGTAWVEESKKLTESDLSSTENYIEFLSHAPIAFIPGESQGYSGTGAFSVLTGIIEKVTNMPYEEFLSREIFGPCRMKDTTFLPSREQWERLIQMHDKKDGQSTLGKTFEGCVFENIPPKNCLGGAGLISSLDDYFNFALMLLNDGVFEGKRIISKGALSELSRPQIAIKESESWGLGVRVITKSSAGRLPVGSFGWSGAYGTHFWVDPENKIIGIYMKNSRYDGGSGAVTAKNFEADVYSAL